MNVLVSSTGMRRDVGGERVPEPILEQILLDVRRVERRDHRAMVARPGTAHRPQRPRPGEVADERDDQIRSCDRLDAPERGFGRR